MTSMRPPGAPIGGERCGHDGHDFATWDAAYVLGALSPTDRRSFEAHLTGCVSCREAVVDLSGIPALLSRLDPETVVAIGDASAPSAPPPDLLPSLLTRVRRRRRRMRLVTWTAAAAAAVVVAIGVLVGAHGVSPTAVPPQAETSALQMAQVGTAALASTVEVRSQRWGTHIVLICVCLAPVNAHHDTLAMEVVGRDGSRTRLATWVAEPGHTATPAGSISTPVDQISSVQVVSADDGQVLLQRTL